MATHKIMESFWYQIIFNVFLILSLYISIRQFGFIAYPITLVCVHVLNIFFCYCWKKYFDIINYSGAKGFSDYYYIQRLHFGTCPLPLHLFRIESKMMTLLGV